MPGYHTWLMSWPADLDRRLTRHYPVCLGLLLVAVLLARLAILIEFLRDNPFSEVLFSDAWVYWYMAGQKAAGQWIEASPFLQAPLYPNLLGLWRWAGGDLTGLYIVQLFVGLATIWLVADATRRRFGASAGLLAALLFALLAEPALAFTYVLADTLQLFLMALALWCWVQLAETPNPGWRWVAGTGAVLGLLALAWPPAQLLVPVYVLWLLFTRNPWPVRLGHAVAGGFMALLLISPATVHNYHVDGTFILISANGGINLYQGNNPDAEGIVTPIPGMRSVRQHMFHDAALIVQREQGRPDSWKTIDDYFRDQALDWWRENPRDGLVLTARKLFWFASSTDYDNVATLSLLREHGLYQLASLAPLKLPWLLGLVLLGVILCLRRPVRYAPELAMVGLVLLVCLMFYYSGRFRLPIAPVACALTAAALVQWRYLPLPVPARHVIAWLPLPVLLMNLMTGWTNVDFQRGDLAMRVAHAHMEHADLRIAAGEPAGVDTSYRRAITAAPEYAAPYLRLALLEYHRGDPGTAAAVLEQALISGAREPALFHLLYNAYIATGNEAAAIAVLRQGLQEHRGDVPLQQAKVWLRATAGLEKVRDPRVAVELAERFLREHGRQARTRLLTALAVAYWQVDERERALAVIEQAAHLAPFSLSREEAGQVRDQAEHMRAGRSPRLDPLLLPVPDPWESPPESAALLGIDQKAGRR